MNNLYHPKCNIHIFVLFIKNIFYVSYYSLLTDISFTPSLVPINTISAFL